MYAQLAEPLPPDKRRELNNVLTRLPGAETEMVPGVPIPPWFDDEDLPPDQRPQLS